MEHYPENHRAYWTNKEDKKLYNEIKIGTDLQTIANNHKRTVSAIKYRLIRYAIDLADEDDTLTLEDLQDRTTLSQEDLLEGFKKLKYDFVYEYNNNNIKDHTYGWIVKEYRQLKQMINKGLDIQTIAEKLDRTEYAVKQKLIEYAMEKYKNDKTLYLNDLCDLTTLSQDELIEGFNKFNININISNEILEEDTNNNDYSNVEVVENNNTYKNLKNNIIDFMIIISCLYIGYNLYPEFNYNDVIKLFYSY